MDKTVIRECIIQAKNGQLKDVLSTLDGKFPHLKSNEAVKLIVCVCNACVDVQTRAHFTSKEATDLVVNCMKVVDDLDSTSMNTFLASIFHILKYLGNKDDCKCVICLQPDLSRILKRNLREEDNLIKLVKNICKIIHNIISTKQSDANPEEISRLCRFSIDILCQTKKLKELLEKEILDYFKSFAYYKINLKYQQDMFMCMARKVMDELNGKSTMVYFQGTFNLLNCVLQNCLKDGKIIEAKEMISFVTGMFISTKIDDVDDVLFIVHHVTRLMCFEEEFPADLSTVLSPVCEKYQRLCDDKFFLQSMPVLPKFLYLLLYYSMQNFRTYAKEFWANFNVENLTVVNKFVMYLYKSLTRFLSKCKGCDSCSVEYDFFSATSVCIIPSHILRYCLSNENKGNCDAILKDVTKSLELGCMMIKKMQHYECSYWKTLWLEVGTLIFNISVGLYRLKHVKAGFYTEFFIQKIILLEGFKSTLLKTNILNSALLNMSECYIVQKEYKKAMLYSAFNIYLHPDNGESAFWQWVRIKSNEKENETLQNLNLVSIILDDEGDKSILPCRLELSNEAGKKLLQFELRQYKKVWPSKTSIVSAFKQLYSFADILEIGKEMVLMWDDGENTIPMDMYDFIFEVVDKFQQIPHDLPSNMENHLSLAFLYLIQYFVAYRKVQVKNREDMKARDIESNDEMSDKNDMCDVVTWYESLKIEVHEEIMKYLKKSLKLFKNLITKDNKNVLHDANLYVVINKIANEFLLQSYTLEYLQSWLLCYRIGKILNDQICIIEAVSNLLEKSDLNSKFISNILVETEELILQIDKDANYEEGDGALRKWICLNNFYISRGLVSLEYGDVDTAIWCLDRIKEIYNSRKDPKTDSKLLNVRFELFQWKMQMLPCKYEIEGHTSVLSKPQFLIENISEQYRNNGHNTYVLCLLFQIFSSVLHMHRWLRQPREVRCYGRDIIVLAQELVIPFTAIRLLSYLADADLLSVRINDCSVKVNGICDILGNRKNRATSSYVAGVEKPIATAIDAVMNAFQEMMLDFPTVRSYRENSSGSPTLLKSSFEIPSFLQHEETCTCFCCMSVDYQEFVLVQIAMQASLCYYEKNLNDAIEYYRGAICVYFKILDNEKSFRHKVEKKLDITLFPSIKHKFNEIYCIILLGLANTLFRSEKFMPISDELVGIVRKNPYFNIHLYNEALFQRLNYLCLKWDEAQKKSPHLNSVVENNSDELVKTPENKCSQVNVTSVYTPMTEPKKSVRKVIKFDLSEKNDKEEVVEKKPSSLRPYVSKTPAVSTSKIQLYQPAAIRSTRKKKVAEQLDFGSKENVKFELPQNTKEVATKLKTKTKLLTEKLKKQPIAIPNIVVTNSSGNDCDIKPRTRAPKNLLTEMEIDNNPTSSASNSNSNCSSENNNKGAIHKRTRSRKVI